MFGPSDVREVHRILLYFQSLADLSREMNPATQIRRTLDSAVAAMAEAFGLKHAMLLAIHDSGGQLLPAAGRGVSLEGRPPLVLSDSARQELLRKPRPIPFRLLPVDCNAWLENAASPSRTADPRSAIPLVTAGELVGLFLFETAGDGNTHAPASNDLLCGMCQNLAVYLYNQIVLSQLTEKRRELEQLAASIKELYRQAVMAFLAAIDIKDGYTNCLL
ncbi:MAG: hypothetical protein N3D11_02230, partial [Candidatus Sumerlaeia bacterium]|nr:hypothetical protein [Candidatus Sumerlaeia bacterium]